MRYKNVKRVIKDAKEGPQNFCLQKYVILSHLTCSLTLLYPFGRYLLGSSIIHSKTNVYAKYAKINIAGVYFSKKSFEHNNLPPTTITTVPVFITLILMQGF